MTVVTASQRTAAEHATYANSITLTPGTITVGVNRDELTIHALVREGAYDLEAGAWIDASANAKAGRDVRRRRRRHPGFPGAGDHPRHKGPTVSTGCSPAIPSARWPSCCWPIGFLTDRPEFLDVGLTYGLLNIVGTLAGSEILRHGDLAYDADGDRPS